MEPGQCGWAACCAHVFDWCTCTTACKHSGLYTCLILFSHLTSCPTFDSARAVCTRDSSSAQAAAVASPESCQAASTPSSLRAEASNSAAWRPTASLWCRRRATSKPQLCAKMPAWLPSLQIGTIFSEQSLMTWQLMVSHQLQVQHNKQASPLIHFQRIALVMYDVAASCNLVGI